MQGEGYCECGCGGRTSIAKQSKTSLGHVRGRPVRFIVGHAMVGKLKPHPPEPLIPRLERFVDVQSNGCWLWTGAITPGGYGQFGIAGRNLCAHRVVYELLAGPIPDGLQLDHLCRVPHCVNPEHLEPVTASENMRRAKSLITHCPRGHAYDEANTYITPRGARDCRTCRNAASRRCKEKKR